VQRVAIYITVAILGMFALAACNNTGGAKGPVTDNAVAATVNGKPIQLSEVDKLIHQQMQGKESELSPLEVAQARLQVLSGLIQQEVLLQRAEKEKAIPSEEDITNFINAQKQQSGMTEEQFQKRLKDQGMTLETLKEEARKSLAVQKLQDKISGKIGAPSDKEVEDFYNNNKSQFVNARGVTLAAIIVDPADNSQQGIQNDAKGEAEATQKINLIAQRLKSGADFATVAREQSEDSQSLMRGGDIGFYSEDDLKGRGFPPELINKFFTMQVGQFTDPVKSSGRWIIFKLSERREQSENLTLDSPGVRQQIAEALTNQRKQLVNQALIEVAMNDAKVVNNLANNMLSNPSNLSGLRPAAPANAGAAQPAQNANAAPPPTANRAPAQSANTAAPAK
jgi:parvulin-like peptidyl-prolyl isomerase